MNNEMTPELKQEWLTALKSGKYSKGYGRLYCNGSYCCLGVLADIRGDLEKDDLDKGYIVHPSGFKNNIFYGPKQGLFDDNKAVALSVINDHNDDFTKVIAYIEENITPTIPDTTLEVK